MKKSIVTAGALSALALCVAACQPADDTADAAAENTADAAAMAASGPTTPGGAMSPPAANEALDTASTMETGAAAASTSYTEAQAKGALEGAGYTGVTALTKTPEGLWTGTAMKGGKSATVSVDFKGAITAN